MMIKLPFPLLILLFSIFGFSRQTSAQTVSTPNEVRTEIEIEGTPEQIWNLLVDFEKYPEWHPYLSHVSGTFKKGRYLTFTLKNSEGKFKARLLEITPHQEISWGGNLWFLFRAKHYFQLVPIDDTHTKLIQGETWKGLFGKAYGKNIYLDLTDKFIEMNRLVQTLIEG